MDATTLINGEKYLDKLFDLIANNNMIVNPKELFPFVIASRNKEGKLIGWEISDSEVLFADSSYLDCDEYAQLEGDRFIIPYFSYHFEPSPVCGLNCYRIDLDGKGLHLNPSSETQIDFDHAIYWSDLDVNITDFNCFLAIHLALLYIKEEIYPAVKGASFYNKSLEGLRRSVV